LVISFEISFPGIVPEKNENLKLEEQTITFDDFNEAVAYMDTPQKLVSYLKGNFVFEPGENELTLKPQELFDKKKGDSRDFAIFASYILDGHNYEAVIIRYKYGDNINAVIVFRDEDLPKTIIFTSEGAEIYAHGWSFEEMLQKEEEKLGVHISEYAVSYWTDTGELWPEEWSARE
jgi:hypothetical protein